MAKDSLLPEEPPSGVLAKKIPALPAERDVAIREIELDPACHPLERQRRNALAQACEAAITDGDLPPVEDLVPCEPADSAAPTLACPVDLHWVIALSRGGAQTVRARVWPDESTDVLERRVWRDRVKPKTWGQWERAVFIAELLRLRGASVEDETQEEGTPSQKSIARNVVESASTVSSLVKLATMNDHLLRLLDPNELRVKDGARVQSAVRAGELEVVQRAVSLAALQGRGGEVSVETAISVLTGRLNKTSAQKPMVIACHEGPVERAGSVLACLADALAKDVAPAIRPTNQSQVVTQEPLGWLREAGTEHALIKFVAPPTPAQLKRIEHLLRTEALLP